MSLDNSSNTLVHPFVLLGYSLKNEYNYYPKIEGSTPKEIQGTLLEKALGYLNVMDISSNTYWMETG